MELYRDERFALMKRLERAYKIIQVKTHQYYNKEISLEEFQNAKLEYNKIIEVSPRPKSESPRPIAESPRPKSNFENFEFPTTSFPKRMMYKPSLPATPITDSQKNGFSPRKQNFVKSCSTMQNSFTCENSLSICSIKLQSRTNAFTISKKYTFSETIEEKRSITITESKQKKKVSFDLEKNTIQYYELTIQEVLFKKNSRYI
jgi:hypothetical protein